MAGAGLLSALLAHWIYEREIGWLTALISFAVLAPPSAVVWWWLTRQGWARTAFTPGVLPWLAVALPFPYTLLVITYGYRVSLVPDAWQDYVNNPTAYLLFVCGGLALSLVWTGFVLQRLWPERPETGMALQGVAITLFVLMGAVAMLGDPVWIGDLYGYVLEPLGTVLYAGVLGREVTRESTTSVAWNRFS